MLNIRLTASLLMAGFLTSAAPGQVPGVDGGETSQVVEPGSRTIAPLDRGVTLFKHVNVLTMTDAGMLKDQQVLVREGRIATIEPATAAAVPSGARVVEGRGEMYLIPGLCDLHLHFPPMTGEKGDPAWRAVTLLVANGVTTARGMIGHVNHLELRRRVLEGELVGPTLHIAGPPISVQVVKVPRQAEAMVEDQVGKGFDFIKMHRVINPGVFDAGNDAARRLRIPVSGHVDNEVGLDLALADRQQIEHLDAFFAAILMAEGQESSFGQIPLPTQQDLFDLDRIPAVAESIAKARVWSGPTMALFRNIARSHEPAEKWNNRDELRYILPAAREMWIKQREAMGAQGPLKNAKFAQWFIDTRATMLRAIRDKGGRVLACSDSPQAFLVTGFALHDELQAMVDAGLTPREALAAATANPAAYFSELANKGSAMGIAPDFGTVAVGKRADLVLVAGNPLEDISATRRIHAVMLRGKLIDRAGLDALLKDVEQSVKAG